MQLGGVADKGGHYLELPNYLVQVQPVNNADEMGSLGWSILLADVYGTQQILV